MLTQEKFNLWRQLNNTNVTVWRQLNKAHNLLAEEEHVAVHVARAEGRPVAEQEADHVRQLRFHARHTHLERTGF